jgi:hypothetical protein
LREKVARTKSVPDEGLPHTRPLIHLEFATLSTRLSLLYIWGERYANLGQMMSRECRVMSRTINVIARSICDEAIQLLLAVWIASLSLAMTVVGDWLFEN